MLYGLVRRPIASHVAAAEDAEKRQPPGMGVRQISRRITACVANAYASNGGDPAQDGTGLGIVDASFIQLIELS